MIEFASLVLQWLRELYEAAPLSIRFAYTFWLVLGVQYLILHYYDKMHNNDILKERKHARYNMPYAVHIPLFVTLILYNLSIATKSHAVVIGPDTYQRVFAVIGFLLLAAGLFLATWGRLSLNSYWGPNLYNYPEHLHLETRGSYRFLRHPIFTGQMGMAIGTFLIANSWWASALLLVLPLSIIRAMIEEKYMKGAFGQKYIKYKQCTMAFMPWKSAGCSWLQDKHD